MKAVAKLASLTCPKQTGLESETDEVGTLKAPLNRSGTMASAQAKMAALRKMAAKNQQARDAIGRFASSTSGTQAGSATRKEIYKAGIGTALDLAHASVPHAALVSGLLAAATEATLNKVISRDEAGAIQAQKGEVLGSAEHTPAQAGMTGALHEAIGKLPDLIAKFGTTQLLSHGIQAVLTHGLHMDAGASAMVSHVAAAAIEPHARTMATSLYSKLKRHANQKYAPA